MPSEYKPPTPEEMQAMREQARRIRETPVTITLLHEEWQTILAAMYRAMLADAKDVTAADRGELDDPELDPLMLIGVLAETSQLREKLHELMHQGEQDQASWSPDKEE